MTPVHFMGREIGWFVTDRLGVCRYLSIPPEIMASMRKAAERSKAAREQNLHFDHMGLPCDQEFIERVYRREL